MVGDDVVTSVMPPVPHLPVLEVGQVGAEVAELLLQTVRGVRGAFQNVPEQFPEFHFIIGLELLVLV